MGFTHQKVQVGLSAARALINGILACTVWETWLWFAITWADQ